MKDFERELDRRYDILKRSVPKLLPHSSHAAERVGGLWKPPLFVTRVGPFEAVSLSRQGKNGKISYVERLEIYDVDAALNGVRYTYDNDLGEKGQHLDHSGREYLLSFDLPTMFILALPHYVRMARFGFRQEVPAEQLPQIPEVTAPPQTG